MFLSSLRTEGIIGETHSMLSDISVAPLRGAMKVACCCAVSEYQTAKAELHALPSARLSLEGGVSSTSSRWDQLHGQEAP